MFCVDGFGAVACGVRVVVGFWVWWLAVFGLLWVFGCGGLRLVADFLGGLYWVWCRFMSFCKWVG